MTIERIEYEIAERAWTEGWVVPVVAQAHTGKSVAVVGSGPAGLAVAQQLARAGHKVTVFERAEMPGGLLRYGIPEFKMEKAVLDRRIAQLVAEGVEFRCGVSVGLPEPVRRPDRARTRTGIGQGMLAGRRGRSPLRELARCARRGGARLRCHPSEGARTSPDESSPASTSPSST